ncbi:MAG TPA: hypothetical protein EYN93_10970 [Planctomycetaceae bacterium]|nr:hypothetical protein [Planctomycetaceae bacterium]
MDFDQQLESFLKKAANTISPAGASHVEKGISKMNSPRFKGDVGGSIGKGMQAAGGAALLVPGIGWATGAVLLGSGMLVDALFGESDDETQVRELMERRLESFGGQPVPSHEYTPRERKQFEEARALASKMEATFLKIYAKGELKAGAQKYDALQEILSA